MQGIGQKQLSPAKEAAYIAVTCALAIAVQYALSFAAGVELVTLIFVCFAAVFGVRRGVLLAAVFTLLRGVVFGFYPVVMLLYAVYYPLLAVVFGCLGRIPEAAYRPPRPALVFVVNAVLLALATACALCYGLDVVKVSKFFKATVSVLLWVIFSLCIGLALAFDILLAVHRKAPEKIPYRVFQVILMAAVASVCTVCFTLLDDVLTPWMFGYTRLATTAYFYASFTAMLPQVACTAVSVCALYAPVTKIFSR